jgi:hypothetical protein
MVRLAFMTVVMMPVSAAFGLESCLDSSKIYSETAEHVFDHVVRPNKKHLFSNLSRQVSITQVPGQAHQLNRICVSYFDSILASG